MKGLLVIISCLFVTSSYGQCLQYLNPVNIAFDVNSSYFSSQYTKQIQEFIQQTSTEDGYLLLELPLSKGGNGAKMQEYNLWLANRRIERVKNYLTQSDVQSPIITRLLTASKLDSRTVSLRWCQQATDNTDLANSKAH